jgi:hypothetical protein
MSSPKRTAQTSSRRTAQDALNRAAKAASRPGSEEPPRQTAKRASLEAKQLAATIERGIADGRLDLLTTDALHVLIAAACRLYAARREAGEQLAPVAKHSLSATDVMATASGLLQAADLAVFELGLWQGSTGR